MNQNKAEQMVARLHAAGMIRFKNKLKAVVKSAAVFVHSMVHLSKTLQQLKKTFKPAPKFEQGGCKIIEGMAVVGAGNPGKEIIMRTNGGVEMVPDHFHVPLKNHQGHATFSSPPSQELMDAVNKMAELAYNFKPKPTTDGKE